MFVSLLSDYSMFFIEDRGKYTIEFLLPCWIVCVGKITSFRVMGGVCVVVFVGLVVSAIVGVFMGVAIGGVMTILVGGVASVVVISGLIGRIFLNCLL